MKPGMSVDPCRASAASCKPATQPSVLSSSAATATAVRAPGHHLTEEGERLVGGEAQLGGTNLGELPPCTQSGKGQGRVHAAGDHPVHARGQLLLQEGHRLVDGGGLACVVVVQHESDRLTRSARLGSCIP
jgi:hypothetical protein